MINSALLATALITLGLSILTSLIGMLLPISRVATGGDGGAAIFLFVASIILFIVGVATAARLTVDMPDWVYAAVLIIVGGVIGLTMVPVVLAALEEEEKDPEEKDLE